MVPHASCSLTSRLTECGPSPMISGQSQTVWVLSHTIWAKQPLRSQSIRSRNRRESQVQPPMISGRYTYSPLATNGRPVLASAIPKIQRGAAKKRCPGFFGNRLLWAEGDAAGPDEGGPFRQGPFDVAPEAGRAQDHLLRKKTGRVRRKRQNRPLGWFWPVRVKSAQCHGAAIRPRMATR